MVTESNNIFQKFLVDQMLYTLLHLIHEVTSFMKYMLLLLSTLLDKETEEGGARLTGAKLDR